ncbi:MULTISPECIES: ASCH domain-containing protein [unclassified Afipia]|uniref:ASCH domain-containing protein n=2 Tax=Afipia TaxID=1033 RepID=UPI0009E0365D|nr:MULTISPECIES: ASCH domain-containing protein [unclassified Afipia]
MTKGTDILISLKPKYANQVFDGLKTVELRRRRPNVNPGTRIWIYATTPAGAIKGYASIARIDSATPASIWKTWGSRTGLSKDEFDSYFEDREFAHAIVLRDVMVMKNSLSLAEIRELVTDFHPPQFYFRLNGAKRKMRLSSRQHTQVNKRKL